MPRLTCYLVLLPFGVGSGIAGFRGIADPVGDGYDGLVSFKIFITSFTSSLACSGTFSINTGDAGCNDGLVSGTTSTITGSSECVRFNDAPCLSGCGNFVAFGSGDGFLSRKLSIDDSPSLFNDALLSGCGNFVAVGSNDA